MASTDTEHYLRLHLLNVEGGTPVLREVLLEHVKRLSRNGCLNHLLNGFKDDIIQLQRRGIINKHAYSILFPNEGVTDINQWDVSLLCCILLNFCTLDGRLTALKVLLNKEIKNENQYSNLKEFLSYNKDKVHRLKDVSEKQIELLYPPTGEDSNLDSWDIELIVCIVFNLCCDNTQQKVIETFRDFIIKEMAISDSGISLSKFLSERKATLEILKKQDIFTDDQYAQLFPTDNRVVDIYTWNSGILKTIVLNVCPKLSKKAIKAVRTIREVRNMMVAHKGTAELKYDGFLGIWSDLFNSIKKLLKCVPRFKKDHMAKIRKLEKGPLDLQSAIYSLKEWYLKDSSKHESILEVLRSFEENVKLQMDLVEKNRCEDYKALMTKIDYIYARTPEITYTERADIRCVDIVFVIKGNSREAVHKAEEFVYNAMRSSNDDNTKKLKAMDVILNSILKDGATIVEVKRGSVVLKIKCISIKGLRALLNTIESDELQEQLGELSDMLSEMIGTTISINAAISSKSLIELHGDISKINSSNGSNKAVAGTSKEMVDIVHGGKMETDLEFGQYRKKIKVRLKPSSIENLSRIKAMLQTEAAKTDLKALSEDISEHLQEEITVSAMMEMDAPLTIIDKSRNLVHQEMAIASEETPTGPELKKLEQRYMEEHQSTSSKRKLPQVCTEDDSSRFKKPKLSQGKYIDRKKDKNISTAIMEESDVHDSLHKLKQSLTEPSIPAGGALDAKERLINRYKVYLRDCDFSTLFHHASCDLDVYYASLSDTSRTSYQMKKRSLTDFLHKDATISIIDSPVFNTTVTLYTIVNDWVISQENKSNTILTAQQQSLKRYDVLLVTEGTDSRKFNICSGNTLHVITNECTFTYDEIISDHSAGENFCTTIILNNPQAADDMPITYHLALQSASIKSQEGSESHNVGTQLLQLYQSNETTMVSPEKATADKTITTLPSVKTALKMKNIVLLGHRFQFPIMANVLSLSLDNVTGYGVEIMDILSNVKKLTTLTMKDINLLGYNLRFPAMDNLVSLCLEDVDADDKTMNTLSSMNKLSIITLRTSWPPFPVIDNKLSLSLENAIGDDVFMATLPNMKNLTTLTMKDIRCWESKFDFPVMDKVVSLTLENVNGDDVIVNTLSGMKNLLRLSMKNTWLLGSMFPFMDNLVSLYLEDVTVDDETMITLSNMGKLVTLTMKRTWLLRSKLRFPVMDNLVTLSLEEMHVCDETLNTLSDMKI